MMKKAVDQFDRAQGRIARDFKSLIADSEDLLNSAATVSGEGLAVARKRFEERVSNAKAALTSATQPLSESTQQAAAAADDFVHANPWSAVGIGTLAGMLVGYLALRR